MTVQYLPGQDGGVRPRLLDLFCGAGGAAMGYSRAGFEVVGVDIKPQPHYPFEFHQADAMTFPLANYDAIHASPPCQGYSIMRNLPWLRGKEYPLLIPGTLARLTESGVPYVIENVYGARRELPAGWLCGGMFGLPFYRHRLFATNWAWFQPGHPRHQFSVRNGRTMGSRARDIVHNGAQRVGANVGHAAGVQDARDAMECQWMTRDELSQAIPPAYTEYIGSQLMAVIRGEVDDD